MDRLVIILFLIAVLTCQTSMMAQTGVKDSNTLQMIVVDHISLDPLSYINVYDKKNQRGTVTNFGGYFELKIDSEDDMIEFTAIGFRPIRQKVSFLRKQDTLRMEQQSIELKEFHLTAEDPGLIKMILNCKKKQHTRKYESKTYFELETYINKKQVELVEIYFNGAFRDHKVDHLSFKEGRIGLSKFNQDYFISADISKAFYSFDLFHRNDKFPRNPFNFSAEDLTKNYRFKLAGRYPDEDGHNIVGIRFYTRTPSANCFQGTLWLDSTASTIQKLNLEIENASVYPFAAFIREDSLYNVSMEMNIVFSKRNGEMVFNNLNFDYTFMYFSKRSSTYQVSSNAILYAYDPLNKFIPPLYEKKFETDNDYRNVSSAPYNSFFWDYMNEFQLNSIHNRNNLFYDQPGVVTNKSQFKNLTVERNGFFQHNYLFWETKRIRFSPVPDSLRKRTEGMMPSDMYAMGIKLYADINQKGDSLHVLSSAVYDPFHTFFYFPIDDASDCFLNIYFDLVEIKRREFEQELKNNTLSEATALQLYQENNNELQQVTNTFLNEAEHGTNLDGMRKWNQYVKDRLGIDNMSIFGLH